MKPKIWKQKLILLQREKKCGFGDEESIEIFTYTIYSNRNICICYTQYRIIVYTGGDFWQRAIQQVKE